MLRKRLGTIALFIPELETGGAERQLIELAKALDKEAWKVLILTLRPSTSAPADAGGTNGIEFFHLSGGNRLYSGYGLLRILAKENVNILHSYLMGAQYYSFFASLFFRNVKFIFSIRDSRSYAEYDKTKGKIFNWMLKRFSHRIGCLIFNSRAGFESKKSLVPSEKVRIIPNGIDTRRFHPDRSCRASLRAEIGAQENDLLVGALGNVNVYKDYATFIRAAKIIQERMENVRFVLIGKDGSELGREMKGMAKKIGLDPVFHFLGHRKNADRLLAGLDVLCSSSVTESFSNAICEGMACGIPCVATDVGDSALIVGDTGIVVPPRSPGLLADGILRLLQLDPVARENLGKAARSKIIRDYSMQNMVADTEEAYKALIDARRFDR
jgi:glycosyltransferase involved in cell wall biosynthesis